MSGPAAPRGPLAKLGNDDLAKTYPIEVFGKPITTAFFLTHLATHLDWHLRPVRWLVPTRAGARAVAALTAPWPDGRWFAITDALALGLPAPLRKRLAAG